MLPLERPSSVDYHTKNPIQFSSFDTSSRTDTTETLSRVLGKLSDRVESYNLRVTLANVIGHFHTRRGNLPSTYSDPTDLRSTAWTHLKSIDNINQSDSEIARFNSVRSPIDVLGAIYGIFPHIFSQYYP